MARRNGTKASVEADVPVGVLVNPASPLETVVPQIEVEVSGEEPTQTATFEEHHQPDPAVPMTMSADMAEAGRSILVHHLDKMAKAEPVARDGSDPEGVHDLRVATRRLRASLKVLEETCYDPARTRRFRQNLRGLAQALSDTRDSDVLLEHLDHYRAQLGEEDQAGLEPLHRDLLTHQARSRKTMLKSLDSSRTHKLLRKLEHFAGTPGLGVRRHRVSDEVKPSQVGHFVASTVWRRYEAMLAYETVIHAATPEPVLHRLRVAAKQLRYTLEFFEEALPPTLKTLQKQLVETQDILGTLHDHYVAIELCERLLKGHPDDSPLRAYQSQRATEMESLKTNFLPHWQNLVGNTFKSRLATALKG